MESANLHLQDHLPSASFSLSGSPSSYGVAEANPWNPNIILSNSNFIPNIGEAISNLGELRHKNDTVVSSLDNSMIRDSNFNHWATSSSSPNHDQSSNGKIKEELADLNPKFTHDLNDLSEKLMLKTLTSSYRANAHQFSLGEVYSYPQNFSNFGTGVLPSRGNFSHCQIYPSINVSNLSQYSSLPPSSSPSIESEPLDLQASARFIGSFHQRSSDCIVKSKESEAFGQAYSQKTPPSTIKASQMNTGSAAEAKRACNSVEPKASQSAPKKPRIETRTSCPPFKLQVRKEKLGDRIAALQQLVAPFGKTDTASVLMEAIGYIKFLTSQVETLCVPYVKSSRSKTSRHMHGGVSGEGDGSDEPKQDLRSRGLCLVPLSCMTYITSTDGSGPGGGGIWPPPNFSGGT